MNNMENPKKLVILVRAVAFAAVFCVLFVVASYLLRPPSYGRTIIAGYYAEKPQTMDVVYIGGSVCFVSWAPLEAFREQGIASHNFACDTLQADTLKYAITDVLKSQSPKLLVIDSRPFEYRDTEQPPREVPIRNMSDSMSYSWNRTMMLLNIVPSVLHGNTEDYLFDIAKYHSRWGQLNKRSFDYALNRYPDNTKGFAFIAKRMALDEPADKSTVTQQVAPYAATDAILTDLLEFCKKKGLNVLFVVAPYREPDDNRRVLNYVGDRVKSYGFDYVNFNDYYDQIGIDFSKDFYNKDHLNIYGAEKYTAFLSQYLTEHYDIPDRREDPKYDDWYSYMDGWDASVASVKQTIEDAAPSN